MEESIIVEYTVQSNRRGVGEVTYSHYMDSCDLDEFHEWASEKGIEYTITIVFEKEKEHGEREKQEQTGGKLDKECQPIRECMVQTGFINS